MALPDKWKQPPQQAKREEKKISHDELVAKLLATGLARSNMEAQAMAQSMVNIEKTQAQFEVEINKVHNAPRAKPVTQDSSAADFLSAVQSSDVVGNDSDAQIAIEGMSKAHLILVKDMQTLRDHIARQQHTIERLEQDVAFIRSLLQKQKTGVDVEYPKTPTAAELLSMHENDENSASAQQKPDVEQFNSQNNSQNLNDENNDANNNSN